MKYPIKSAMIFLPQLLADYDHIYTYYIYIYYVIFIFSLQYLWQPTKLFKVSTTSFLLGTFAYLNLFLFKQTKKE